MTSCGGGDTERQIIRDRNVANSAQIDAPTTAVFCQKYQALATWAEANTQGDAAWANQVSTQLYAMLPDAPSANVQDVNDMLALYNAVARSAPATEQTSLADAARAASDRLNTLCNVVP
ncbi:MAG TPA: hypothetical protein PKV27_02940 [Ilumatobacteraceae bacterium]|nr:hypothetical protein [Ilumatobacteraceae bacterium]